MNRNERLKRSEFGKCLAKLRIDRDDEAKVMAVNLGVSVGTLRNYEYGLSPVPMTFFNKIMDVYGEDYMQFYVAAPVGRSRSMLDLRKLDDETRMKIEALLSINVHPQN